MLHYDPSLILTKKFRTQASAMPQTTSSASLQPGYVRVLVPESRNATGATGSVVLNPNELRERLASQGSAANSTASSTASSTLAATASAAAAAAYQPATSTTGALPGSLTGVATPAMQQTFSTRVATTDQAGGDANLGEDLRAYPWYFADCDRERSERLLASHGLLEGMFLLRPSTS